MDADEDLTGIPKEGDLIAGKFAVEKVLGVGGMGVVVAARHVQLGQRVAVKFLRSEAAKNKEAVGRFLREARAVVALQSAHVVRVMDVGTLDDGMPYMVMEHLAGEDLSDTIRTRRAIGVEEAVDYVLQGCEAIAEAHALGIVHRDLKPSNLFLTRKPDGSPLVKVLDFGISKAADAPGVREQSLTATSSVMGSPLYMSPEQLRSSKKVDARTDVWALGVILYELTCGSTPFEDETMTGLCAKIVADAPSSLRQRRPELPLAFEAVVMRCLEKDLARRFQSVGELAGALREFASIEGRMAADRVQRIAGPPRAPMPSAAEYAATERRPAPSSAASTPSSSGHTGFADTVGTWQTGDERRRRRTAIAVATGVVAVVGVIGVAFVALRESKPSVAIEPPSPATTVAPPSPPPASIEPLAPLLQPAVSASAPPSASAKRPLPPSSRPVAAPKPPAPAPGADLLQDRK